MSIVKRFGVWIVPVAATVCALRPDPQSVLVTAPSPPTGAAMLVIKGELHATPATVKSCTGFHTCLSGAFAEAAGPVSVVVTP